MRAESLFQSRRRAAAACQRQCRSHHTPQFRRLFRSYPGRCGRGIPLMKNENIASGIRWQIFVDGLKLMTHVGLHAHEYQQPQAVELDIEMSYRTSRNSGDGDDGDE